MDLYNHQGQLLQLVNYPNIQEHLVSTGSVNVIPVDKTPLVNEKRTSDVLDSYYNTQPIKTNEPFSKNKLAKNQNIERATGLYTPNLQNNFNGTYTDKNNGQIYPAYAIEGSTNHISKFADIVQQNSNTEIKAGEPFNNNKNSDFYQEKLYQNCQRGPKDSQFEQRQLYEKLHQFKQKTNSVNYFDQERKQFNNLNNYY